MLTLYCTMHDMYMNRPIQFHSLLVQFVSQHIPNSVDQNSIRRSQPRATLEDHSIGRSQPRITKARISTNTEALAQYSYLT